jgi:uncharacterized membrane protein
MIKNNGWVMANLTIFVSVQGHSLIEVKNVFTIAGVTGRQEQINEIIDFSICEL